MKLDPTSLKLFVSVIEQGTMAAAAERNHIAAAAVSKRISELESVLQTRLLMRSNKGIEPTAAGIALLIEYLPNLWKAHSRGATRGENQFFFLS